MSMTNRAVVVLRILLVLLFVALLVGQTLSIPGQLAYMASQSPVAPAEHGDGRPDLQ